MTQLACRPPIKMMIDDIQETRVLVDSLLKTKHYQRLGPEGIFAIIQKAKATNVNPLDALNGGMYYVQGKVEMSAFMMNQLIRQAGHSISKDEQSDDTVCILHGKRVDTGDTWTEIFSIDDAKRAGIYREGTGWTKYPRNMLFARALSNLARMLFPDVIQGCYVEGELGSELIEPEPCIKQGGVARSCIAKRRKNGRLVLCSYKAFPVIAIPGYSSVHLLSSQSSAILPMKVLIDPALINVDPHFFRDLF